MNVNVIINVPTVKIVSNASAINHKGVMIDHLPQKYSYL